MKSYQNIYFQFCIYFYILPTSMSLNCSAIKHKSLEKTHQLGAWQMLCLKDYFFVILDNDVLDRIFSLLKYIEQKIFSFINEHERELVHSIITCNQHPHKRKCTTMCIMIPIRIQLYILMRTHINPQPHMIQL